MDSCVCFKRIWKRAEGCRTGGTHGKGSPFASRVIRVLSAACTAKAWPCRAHTRAPARKEGHHPGHELDSPAVRRHALATCAPARACASARADIWSCGGRGGRVRGAGGRAGRTGRQRGGSPRGRRCRCGAKRLRPPARCPRGTLYARARSVCKSGGELS